MTMNKPPQALVIYDSLYGNTQKIAETIAKSLNTKAVNVAVTSISDLQNLDLLIVGSPTHGGQPKPELQQFLDQIPPTSLKNISIAAFDTRFLESDLNFALRLLIKIIGYAAPKIAAGLQSKGGKQLTAPMGFIVTKKAGPLKAGELNRAAVWAQQFKAI